MLQAAECDRGVRLEGAFDSHALRDINDLLRAYLHDEAGEDRIDRPVRGRLQRHTTRRALVLVVLDVPHAVFDLHRVGRGAVDRLRADTLLQRGDKDERLERGAGLPLTLRGQVELVLPEVATAHHRDDLAGAVANGDQRDFRVACRSQLGGGLECFLLDVGLKRRVDAQASAVDAFGTQLLDELLTDVVGEVWRERRHVLRGRDLHRLCDGGGPLGASEMPLVEHLSQHEVASPFGYIRFAHRVVARRGPDDSGKQRALRYRERLGLLAEVALRSALDAISPVAKVHGVEIETEDLFLADLDLELIGENRLADLARKRPLAVGEEQLRELLRDGASALFDLSRLRVAAQSARDAVDVDAVMLVKALVFDGDDCRGKMRAHARQGYDLAVFDAMPFRQHTAVGGVDQGGLLGGGTDAVDGRAGQRGGETVEVRPQRDRADGDHGENPCQNPKGDADALAQHRLLLRWSSTLCGDDVGRSRRLARRGRGSTRNAGPW